MGKHEAIVGLSGILDVIRVGSENSSNLEPFAEVEQVKLNKILGFPQQPKSNW